MRLPESKNRTTHEQWRFEQKSLSLDGLAEGRSGGGLVQREASPHPKNVEHTQKSGTHPHTSEKTPTHEEHAHKSCTQQPQIRNRHLFLREERLNTKQNRAPVPPHDYPLSRSQPGVAVVRLHLPTERSVSVRPMRAPEAQETCCDCLRCCAREDGPPPHPPSLFGLFCRRHGSRRAYATNVRVSTDHLPPTSTAKPTRRARLPGPTNSPLFAPPGPREDNAVWQLHPCQRTISVKRAHQRRVHRKLRSTTTSSRRLSVASSTRKSKSRRTYFCKFGQNMKTLILDKCGLAKCGQKAETPILAKFGLAKLGHDPGAAVSSLA